MGDIVPIVGEIVPQWIEPFYEHAIPGGWQKLYRFPNGYGASVVDAPGNYSGNGTWEIAVIYWRGTNIDDWDIVSDTPVTHDVLGWQTDVEVEVVLRAIQALPKRRKEIQTTKGDHRLTQRYTVKDVREVFDTFKELAVRLGVPGATDWRLREGSAVNGRPYRFYSVGPSGGQWEPIPFPNYLGSTAREAWDHLSAYLTGMRAVVRTLSDANVNVWPTEDEPTV